MRNIFTIAILSVFMTIMANAQQDTMYIHLKTGTIVHYVVSDIDSIVFYGSGGGNTVTDFDGNVYTTVQIGSQTWLGQNLKTTHYNDGTPIPLQTAGTVWDTLSTHAYCWYDNNINNKEPYGALYNWFVASASENIGKNPCPTGWHVPDDDEWTALTNFLGGATVAAGKLKESGTAHWNPPNAGATNETGFTALPGGFRGTGSLFVQIGDQGNWWSTDGHPTYGSSAYYRSMSFSSAGVYKSILGKTFGMSIRCIQD